MEQTNEGIRGFFQPHLKVHIYTLLPIYPLFSLVLVDNVCDISMHSAKEMLKTEVKKEKSQTISDYTYTAEAKIFSPFLCSLREKKRNQSFFQLDSCGFHILVSVNYSCCEKSACFSWSGFFFHLFIMSLWSWVSDCLRSTKNPCECLNTTLQFIAGKNGEKKLIQRHFAKGLFTFIFLSRLFHLWKFFKTLLLLQIIGV